MKKLFLFVVMLAALTVFCSAAFVELQPSKVPATIRMIASTKKDFVSFISPPEIF